jgi:hypothetical protein
MTHPIIKTDNYLLVVDDSEIKVGDTVYYTIYGEDENEVPDTEPFRIGVDVVRDINSLGNLEFEMESLIALPKECKKIISHLPLSNSPLLEGVDLLPPLEDNNEVWEQGLEKEINKLPYTKHLDDGQYNDGQLAGFEFGATWGYNKAKEKYKYTEEDMRFAIKSAFMQGVERVPYLHQLEDNIIKAIQQQKYPVAFECEENIFFATNAFCTDITLTSEGLQDTVLRSPKTTTPPQGQTVWGGNL